MKKTTVLILVFTFFLNQSCNTTKLNRTNTFIAWQPSHQTDTGKDFSEAAVSNAIVEAAMETNPKMKEYKVWSLGNENVHHPNVGSNTVIEHTSAIIDGKISGYAYELQDANKHHPEVFIAVHSNGGTKRHAIWGYIHYGDQFESANRELAATLLKAVCSATDLENRGVLLDSTTGRNDYRCKTTGKLSFYSLDENINTAPYRVLLEVGDNAASRDFLLNPSNQKKVGGAIKQALADWLENKRTRN
ncbi:MAG: N-acetylmuramoyl-L-alanine amidase [Chitinophagaceae bacterium]|nr:N-acetylmuramoyl-L-alanine amidase [Chitinophagaceae bacterium]